MKKSCIIQLKIYLPNIQTSRWSNDWYVFYSHTHIKIEGTNFCIYLAAWGKG